MGRDKIKILDLLAKKIILKYNPIVIGIVGDTNRDSTSRIIYEVLSKKHRVGCNYGGHFSEGNISAAIISPNDSDGSTQRQLAIFARALNFLSHKSDSYPEIIVLDMRTEKAGDMKKILEIVRPQISVLMSSEEVSISNEKIKNDKLAVREKALLLKSLGKSDLAVFNVDDENMRGVCENIKAQKMSFGFSDMAKVKGEEIFLANKKWRIENGKIGMSFKITYQGTTVPFRFSYALGRGHIYAALAGTAVGLYLGFNLMEIAEALSDYRAQPGKMNLIKGKNDSLIIDDTFGSGPLSMLSALDTLKKLEASRKIAVLGDIKASEKNTKEVYKYVGGNVAESVDLLFCCGEFAEYFCKAVKKKGMEEDHIFYFKDKSELARELNRILSKDDVVLVKGSRAMKMEEVVKAIMLEPERAEDLLVK
ncbi:MAG: cyanophycin synthetase [Candidatus Paceibacterota bacterium]